MGAVWMVCRRQREALIYFFGAKEEVDVGALKRGDAFFTVYS